MTAEERARLRTLSGGLGLAVIRTAALRDLLDALDAAEARAARSEGVIADALRSLPAGTHFHDGRPCTSGLSHMEGE